MKNLIQMTLVLVGLFTFNSAQAQAQAQKLEKSISIKDIAAISKLMQNQIVGLSSPADPGIEFYDAQCAINNIFVGQKDEVAQVYACNMNYLASDRYNGSYTLVFKLDESGESVSEVVLSSNEGSY